MSHIWIMLRDCYTPYIDDKYMSPDNEVSNLLNQALNNYRTAKPDEYGHHDKIPVPDELKNSYSDRIKTIIDNNVEGIINMENCMLNSSCCRFTLLRVLKERILEDTVNKSQNSTNMNFIKLKPEEHTQIFNYTY